MKAETSPGSCSRWGWGGSGEGGRVRVEVAGGEGWGPVGSVEVGEVRGLPAPSSCCWSLGSRDSAWGPPPPPTPTSRLP